MEVSALCSTYVCFLQPRGLTVRFSDFLKLFFTLLVIPSNPVTVDRWSLVTVGLVAAIDRCGRERVWRHSLP